MKYLSKPVTNAKTEKLEEARLNLLIFIDEDSLSLSPVISAISLIEEVLSEGELER